jgi:hypothetical protein
MEVDMKISQRIVLFFGGATWKQFLQLVVSALGLILVLNLTIWAMPPYPGLEHILPAVLGVICTLWLFFTWDRIVVPASDEIRSRLIKDGKNA